MATVKVHSGLQNAIELRLHDMVAAEHGAYSINPGIHTARRRDVPHVIVRPGLNEIDAAFWKEWDEQNEGTALRGALLVFGDKKTAAVAAAMESI